MQLSGAALLLCAAAAGMAAGPAPGMGRTGTERRTAAAGGKERRAQFASWDEVNVIAHGLLQLGHGLKEHVDRTKGQMRELGSRLSAHNSSMGRLLRQARETQEQGELLRASVRELEGRGRQLFNLSETLRQRLEEVAADKAEIQGRLEQLEGRVRQALQARPAENQSSKDLGALQVGAERRRGGLRGTRPDGRNGEAPRERPLGMEGTRIERGGGNGNIGADGTRPDGGTGSDPEKRPLGMGGDLSRVGAPDPSERTHTGGAGRRGPDDPPNTRGLTYRTNPAGTRGAARREQTCPGHWEHPTWGHWDLALVLRAMCARAAPVAAGFTGLFLHCRP